MVNLNICLASQKLTSLLLKFSVTALNTFLAQAQVQLFLRYWYPADTNVNAEVHIFPKVSYSLECPASPHTVV